MLEQTFLGVDDHRRHFDTLLPAFLDHPYIRVAGKPAVCRLQPTRSAQLETELKPPCSAGNEMNVLSRLSGLPRSLVSRAVRPLRMARRRRANQVTTERYFATHAVRCLHLGCGVHPLPGWLNSDLGTGDPAILELDATKRFPFAGNALDFIFSEHMIEHVAHQAGQSMLDECFRTLRPGGTVRISTPDLWFLLALFQSELSLTQQQYIRWSTQEFISSESPERAVFVFNNFVRDWGHTFIYDEETLREALGKSGFIGIARCELNESEHSVLQNLENERRMPDGFLRLETMTFEASKP